MDMLTILRASAAGLVATGVMTLIELALRPRWGVAGLLDWQINQATMATLTKKPAENAAAAGVALHFLHGLVGGIVFVLVLPLFPPSWAMWPSGVGFGAVLFALTLAVFRPITGKRLRSGSQGSAGVAVALLTHLAYGAVLGLLLIGP